MKKFVRALIFFVFCFTATACDPGTFVITPQSLEGVVRIQLIDYENPNQDHFISWVPNHFGDLLPYDSTQETVVEELPEEKIDDFLNSFSQTDILNTYYAYNSPKDMCIKLIYENGEFLIIWANYKIGSHAGYIGDYLPDGTVSYFWGCFSSLEYYEDLVNEYFTTQLN